MAADVVPEQEPANPCCSELKKRYLKLEEKRNALRQAVKLLEHQADKLQTENTKIKKACEEERARAELEKEAKEKQSNFRHELEKEVQDLKTEISSLQTGGCLKNGDKDKIVLLENCVLEGEAEIKRLKEQLVKEKKKGDSEKKKAELEKKKGTEAWKLLQTEKNKMEEEKRLAEIERNKALEWKFSLEQSKAEVNEARERLHAEILKADGAKKMFEAEKQKTDREKKRADAEKAKVKELSRLAEADRKKMMDEKTRADRLSQQLVEERQKRQELQREVESTIAVGRGKRDGLSFGEIGNDMKLMKEKLKLERKQVKHAKRMAELKEAEKNLLLKELHLLKRDFIQFSVRLNVLDGFYSQGIEGIDDMTKIGRPSKFRGMNTRNKFVGVEPCDFNSQSKTRDMRTLNMPIDSFGFFGETRATTGPSLPTCGEHLTKPISGTSSELESPIGGSVRNKSQSSAICSTTASFSDRQFVGSQGRSAFVSFPSPMLAEENSKHGSPVLKISSEANKTQQNENTEASLQPCLNSPLVDGAVRPPRRSVKRRKIQDALESIAPTLDCSQDGVISSSLDDVRYLATGNPDDLGEKNYKFNSQKKVPEQQVPNFQPSIQNGNWKKRDNLEKLCSKDACFLIETPTPTIQMMEDVPFCKDRRGDPEAIPCFENIIREDYMKLLDLDNEADEERYRAAREMLLSPTLPEIEFPNLGLYEEDYSHYLVERDGRSDFNIDSSMPCNPFDVIDLEIESNNLKLEISDISHGELSHVHKGFFHSPEDKGCKIAGMSYCEVSKPHVLCSEHTPSFIGNARSPVDQKCDPGRSTDTTHNNDSIPSVFELEGLKWQSRPSSQCSLDPNAICSSKIHGAAGEPSMHFVSDCASNIFSKSNSYPSFLTDVVHNHSRLFTGKTLQQFTELEDSSRRTQARQSHLKENLTEDNGKSPGLVVSQHANNETILQIRRLMDSEGDLLSTTNVTQSSIFHALESSLKMEPAKQMFSPSDKKLECPSGGNDGSNEREHWKNSEYCVVFTSSNDEHSISRILHSRNVFLSQNFMICKRGSVVIKEVLLAFALEPDLLPEEKICVFFSLLLCNICGAALSNLGIFRKVEDILLCSESLVTEINKVMCDVQTKWLFLEICQLDILVSLIEDFLTARKVLMCDVSHGPSDFGGSTSNFYHFDKHNMTVSFKAATADQLLAGSVIFASICTALGHIDILWEVSYKILRSCKSDNLILTVLHVFASVCGTEFFSLGSHSMLVTAIKAVVLLLERQEESVGNTFPCIHSTIDSAPSNLPSKHCPFAKGAVCVDDVMSLLLEELHDIIRPEMKHFCTSKINFPVHMPTDIKRSEESADCQFEGPHMECDASCFLFNYERLVAKQTDCKINKSFCHFVDVVSLVELIGHYMGWDWTYNKIIPHLLKLLECCTSEELSASLFTLIGQLGRVGIEAGRYEQRGYAELRSSLSVLLDTVVMGKTSLPTQFATVNALLDFLPFKFGEIVEGDLEFSSDASQLSHAKLIKKWFSHLGKEQQSLSKRIFLHDEKSKS